jgi:hypothetical protein
MWCVSGPRNKHCPINHHRDKTLFFGLNLENNAFRKRSSYAVLQDIFLNTLHYQRKLPELKTKARKVCCVHKDKFSLSVFFRVSFSSLGSSTSDSE